MSFGIKPQNCQNDYANEIEKLVEFYFSPSLSSISNESPVDDMRKSPTELLKCGREISANIIAKNSGHGNKRNAAFAVG